MRVCIFEDLGDDLDDLGSDAGDVDDLEESTYILRL
jgi:hypothetical protein